MGEVRPGPGRELRALLLSLPALAVPVLAVFAFPDSWADYEALLWLLALIPAFLLAYYRGWRGVATALALGMAILSVTYAIARTMGATMPDLLLGVVVAYLAIALGIGWLTEGVSRARTNEARESMALRDPLTDLPNRRHAEAHLELEIAAAQRGRPLCVVLFDFDHFAHFNAVNGRAAGDGVLRSFATLLRQNTRRMNLAARYGPGEFLCILGGCDETGALIFAARVQERLRAAESTVAVPTVSAGIACYRPGTDQVDLLLRAAEDALRLAKEHGRDRVRVFGRTADELAQSDEDRRSVEEATRTVEAARVRPALRVGPLEPATGPIGAGHAALVLLSDSAARAAIAHQLRAEQFAVIEAESWTDVLPSLAFDFSLAFVELATEAAAITDLVHELRARVPGIRIIGVPRGATDQVEAALLSVRVDGYHVPSTPTPQLRAQLHELLAELEEERGETMRSRQLHHEVRAREREARVAIAATEAKYRAVVQTIQQVIFTTDPALNWTFLNPAWTAITGFNVEESLGHPVWELVHPEERDALRAGLEQMVRSRSPHFRHEARWHTRADTYRWIEARFQLAVTGSGEVESASGLLTDITERRRTEETLRETELRLLHAHKMDAIGRLAGGVAHDFNNLLTAIQGHATLLLEEVPDGLPLRTDLLEIRDAAERATTLTRQLLAFSRRQVLQPRVLDLNLVVADMEKMLRHLVGEHIQLVPELSAPLDLVRADPGQIEQVILNLVVNARDAIQRSGRIVLRTGNRGVLAGTSPPAADIAPGAYVMLEVEDNGVGMTSDVVAQAFEPFFTTHGPGRGSGLGLSTVYGTVRQSGGYVWLRSAPGQGTTVTIYLPRAAETPAAPAAPAAEPGSTAGGNETVLLVEDEKAVRELARKILERRGYRVMVAENGRAALEVQASHAGAIDLLLTDVVMPEMDGPELADRLAELRPDMRVLFMSGYAEEAIRQHGMFGPNRDFMEKPFSPEELLRRVRAAIDAAR